MTKLSNPGTQVLDGLDYAVVSVTESGSHVIVDRIKELRNRLPGLKSEAANYHQVMISNLELHRDAKRLVRQFK